MSRLFALVDKADSLLIDEARIPLVIAGSLGGESSSTQRLAGIVASLRPGVHFDTDEYARDVELTDAGIERLEQALGCGSLHDEKNYSLLTELNCALHAHVLLRRDVDYIVRDGRVEVVDELTGRVVLDRHWPDGPQAAVEAKEGIQRHPNGQILGSITLQHFLRGYARLCGMTGTAQDAASALRQTYGLDVVVVPTHRPMVRVDQPDVVFANRDAKKKALVEEIRRVHATRRPVLAGTLTVEESERLAERLQVAGIACEVLNAKNDAAEARIVARAGALGAVTISTNMASRGTDLRLGGEDEGEREQVAALGGLYVIGTNRHEARRVDLQLRGRARDAREIPVNQLLREPREGPAGALRGPRSHRRAPSTGRARRGHRELGRASRDRPHAAHHRRPELRDSQNPLAAVVESQRHIVMECRQALLHGRDIPEVWQRAPERRAALVAATSEQAVRRAEQTVTLFQINRAWSSIWRAAPICARGFIWSGSPARIR